MLIFNFENMKKERKQRPRMEDLIPNSEIRKEVLKVLYTGEGLTGRDGIFSQVLQDMVNAALEGELDSQLTERKERGVTNRRNGHTNKTLRSKFGPIEVCPPRDRAGEFEPKLVGKWEREIHTGFDEMILSMYGRGQSVEDIRHHLLELYGVELSAGTISAVTSRVWNQIVDWQSRPLSPCYAIIYLDGIHYKVRHEGRYDTKVVQTVGADLRKIYTSATMRKVTKAKGAWTDEKALTKQLFLALTTNEKSWKRQAFNWKTVQKELMEQFGERFSKWIDS
jgi:transposase-like protein